MIFGMLTASCCIEGEKWPGDMESSAVEASRARITRVTLDRPPRFVPDRKAKERPIHPTRHVWTLRRGTDQRVCEIHPVGPQGWDVQIFDNGWLTYAHRVVTRDEADELTRCLRDDCLREEWMEQRH